MNNKLSDKDKRDWQNFISSEEKVQNKDLSLSQMKIDKDLVKTIDLHGFSLENANRTIDEFINRCFKTNISKITVITGKGLRSNNINNPYVSKNLSILKNSVPEFIKSFITLFAFSKDKPCKSIVLTNSLLIFFCDKDKSLL